MLSDAVPCAPAAVTPAPLDAYGANIGALLTQAYGVLDSVARLALGSASRASRVGLRSDTFTYILDDLPLGAGSVSSSVMRVSHVSCEPLGKQMLGRGR